MSKMRFTQKQISVMSVIAAGDGKDANGHFIPVDLDQILERINWRTTKASIQFSLRSLVEYEMIVKLGQQIRRGRNRSVYAPTEQCHEYFVQEKAQALIKPGDLGIGVMDEATPDIDLLSLVTSVTVD